MPDTVASLLRKGQQRLSEFEAARLEAQILLSHVLNTDRSYLYRESDAPVESQLSGQFLNLINKRLVGEPIAHLTGKREFWSMEFIVNKHTLIPRPETEHLIEETLAIAGNDQREKNILDLGTGAGIIAIVLASELPQTNIHATDSSAEALHIAQQNIDQFNLKNIQLTQSSWFDQIVKKPYDIIVSNPPYIANDHPCLHDSDLDFEPEMALTSGADGLDALREIITHSPEYLTSSGWLVVEHGYDQKKALQEILLERGFSAISTAQDYAGHDRITIAQWQR